MGCAGLSCPFRSNQLLDSDWRLLPAATHTHMLMQHTHGMLDASWKEFPLKPGCNTSSPPEKVTAGMPTHANYLLHCVSHQTECLVKIV